MARRFDRYPNFAVDTAARVPYFMMQPRDKVRAFLIKYQDRILYGTDLEGMPDGDTEKGTAKLEKHLPARLDILFNGPNGRIQRSRLPGSFPAGAGAPQDFSRQRRPLAAGN